MTENNNILFEEKQYLGYNKFSFLRRIILALFCFFAYYAVTNENVNGNLVEKIDDSGNIFFFMGVLILVLSVALTFVLHIHTKIEGANLILDGLWTARKVKIDLTNIVSAEKIKYSKYLLNPPIYNLHRRGVIKFYTRGDWAVKLQDKDGLTYIIGTQKPDELLKTITFKIKNKHISKNTSVN